MRQRLRRFSQAYKGHLLHLLIEEHAGWLVRSLPGMIGMVLRWGLFRLLFQDMPSFAFFYPGVYLTHSYGIRVGRGFSVNTGAIIDGRGGIRFGDDVLVGPYAVVTSSNHAFKQLDQPMA